VPPRVPGSLPLPFGPADAVRRPDGYFGETDLERSIAAHGVLVRDIVERVGRRGFSVLDVGAGRGEFLAAASREGVAAVGLEPSRAMVSQGRERLGVELHRQTIEEFEKGADRAFDVATLSGVLEHIHDPSSMMASVRRLVAPGGLLYIDVPREPNLLTILGNGWSYVKGSPAVYNLQPTWPPYHVLGFNPTAIRVLLSRHGFRVQEIRVWASPHVPARSDRADRFRAFVATQVQRVANYVNLASNMFVRAQRE
jgi:SAM-dependent methyltransferase